MSLPTSVPSLSSIKLEVTNEFVEKAITATTATTASTASHRKYNQYTPEKRTAIGEYATENSSTQAAKYFSGKLNIQISVPTIRKFKEKLIPKEITRIDYNGTIH